MIDFSIPDGPSFQLDPTSVLDIGGCVVAGVDKAYESAAPVVLSSRQQQKVNRRVESAAQACASEMAPLLWWSMSAKTLVQSCSSDAANHCIIASADAPPPPPSRTASAMDARAPERFLQTEEKRRNGGEKGLFRGRFHRQRAPPARSHGRGENSLPQRSMRGSLFVLLACLASAAAFVPAAGTQLTASRCATATHEASPVHAD